MALTTKTSLSGFIASEPKLTSTRTGTTRFFARIGQEHWQKDENGKWVQLETTYHNLVQYRKAAQRAFEQFQVGDRFVAEGQIRTYEREMAGEPDAEVEEFVANKLGHDTAWTTYTVDRGTRRSKEPSVDDTQGRERPPGLPSSGPSRSAQPPYTTAGPSTTHADQTPAL